MANFWVRLFKSDQMSMCLNANCLGLVTSRDIDFIFIKASKFDTTKIEDVMVPFEKLITGNEHMTLDQAYEILEEEKKGNLYLIDINST
jgi:CBS domain-containing protein